MNDLTAFSATRWSRNFVRPDLSSCFKKRKISLRAKHDSLLSPVSFSRGANKPTPVSWHQNKVCVMVPARSTMVWGRLVHLYSFLRKGVQQLAACIVQKHNMMVSRSQFSYLAEKVQLFHLLLSLQ